LQKNKLFYFHFCLAPLQFTEGVGRKALLISLGGKEAGQTRSGKSLTATLPVK